MSTVAVQYHGLTVSTTGPQVENEAMADLKALVENLQQEKPWLSCSINGDRFPLFKSNIGIGWHKMA